MTNQPTSTLFLSILWRFRMGRRRNACIPLLRGLLLLVTNTGVRNRLKGRLERCLGRCLFMRGDPLKLFLCTFCTDSWTGTISRTAATGSDEISFSGSDTEDAVLDTLATNCSVLTAADDNVEGLVVVADDANGLVLTSDPGSKTEVARKPVMWYWSCSEGFYR